jgi:17beta-estradiol 17-dehydrogenase / very-long-chain 3-oxoacyl-CoA reductase
LTKQFGYNIFQQILFTKGIGKQFGIQLAKMGFNIVLISRSIDKLKIAQEDLIKANPNIETLIIAADFSKSS